MRTWRYGASWEVELDSLADRLIHDSELRQWIVGEQEKDPDKRRITSGDMANRLHQWRERVRSLATSQDRSYAEQVVLVIQRATEHITATPEGAS